MLKPEDFLSAEAKTVFVVLLAMTRTKRLIPGLY
jgi:hypothetical protein